MVKVTVTESVWRTFYSDQVDAIQAMTGGFDFVSTWDMLKREFSIKEWSYPYLNSVVVVFLSEKKALEWKMKYG